MEGNEGANDLRDRIASLEAALAERTSAVQALGESEERLRTLLENAPDSITVLDERGIILYLNRTVPSRRVEDIIGTSSVAYMPKEDAARFLGGLEAAIRTGDPQTVEVETLGHQRWRTRLVPLKREGRIITVMGIGSDVTEGRRTEEALRRSDETLRIAVRAARMGLWSWNLAADSLLLDDTSAAMLGFTPPVPEMRFAQVLERVHADDQAEAAKAARRFAATGELTDFEFRVSQPDGTTRSLLVSGHSAGTGAAVVLIGAAFDVTERRRLEEQLRQAQKMEAVGQLTAGIAHNFNNLLAAIIPSIQLARREVPAVLGERLEDAEYAATRAAELVKQLMVFARHRRIVKKELVDLRVQAARTVGICRATFDRAIEMDIVEPPSLPLILGEGGQIEQVLLNVCLNARDALGPSRSTHKRIVVELDAWSVESGSASGERYVRLRVSDNGPGMSDEVRARVFEPFFTTKDVGRGTGLGLATAYAIVTDHGGRLSCDSTPGEGTTFTLLLPAVPERPRESGSTDPVLGTRRTGGRETVLIIDDERLVRKAMRSILEPAGYRVLDAADGLGGFELFQRESPHIDLVLLDLSMPGIPGDAVLASILRERPGTRVVLFTGYQPDSLPPGAAAVLQKPVQLDELLRVVRDACDGK